MSSWLEVRNVPQKDLAVELLRKLLNNEIRIRSKKFLIQSKSFANMLEQSIRKYQNHAIEAAAVIQELIELARQMREDSRFCVRISGQSEFTSRALSAVRSCCRAACRA
jgi:type I site-specific restriction-modification system R (restriction) subunit